MSFSDPFEAMQAAVDIIGTSTHETNKISAALFAPELNIIRTNYWPEIILKSFGKEQDIGNSSGTIHAETACILAAGNHATKSASLCVTDPFCPNCAKNIAEAEITKIYIDHKGFDKDFFQRRSGHFKTMSMLVCEKAGIAVYQLWRKDRRISPIYEPPASYVPPNDSPVAIEEIGTASEGIFKDAVSQGFKLHDKRKFALLFAKDSAGRVFCLTARGHAVRGFTMQNAEDLALIENSQNKYTLFQEPVNRLLMTMARKGLTPVPGYFFSAQVPTSREQVNLVGANVRRITIGDLNKGRDADALIAMRQLSDAGLIDYS